MFKKNKANIKVLSQVKEAEYDEVVWKLQQLFYQNGIIFVDKKIHDDWIFVEDGEKIVVAVSIRSFGKFSGNNVYELSSFLSLNYKETKLSLEEYRKAISDIFKKAVDFAKKSKKIDYLVQGVNNFDVRASIRAGFSADLLQKPEMIEVVRALISSVRYADSCAGFLDPFEDRECYKVDCLIDTAVEIASIDDNLYGKRRKGKTNSKLLLALRKTRKFIEGNPAEMAYCGLILGVKTK